MEVSGMRGSVLLLMTVAVAACDLPRDPIAPDAEGPLGRSGSVAAVAEETVPDQMAVAQVVPGFGGYFIEDGRPTVYLTDVSRRAEAEAALAGFLDSFGWTAADLRVREAKYDYIQLDAWYRASWPAALAVTGSVYSDLDERSNRLRFGGVDAGAVAAIANAVTSKSVPLDAIRVEVTAPVVQVASLRDRIRPAHGGLQLNFFVLDASPVSYLCTLGFNAVSGGVNSFVTNSHCTNNQGGSETPTTYYQSSRRSGSLTGGYDPPLPGTEEENIIGVEVDDPHYWISLDCPVGRQCRYSDAARAEYAPGQEFALGRIARTTLLNSGQIHGDDDASVLQIDGSNPHYTLTAEQSNPVLGQTLHKVGRTTGWTSGQVTGTCVNVNISGSTITQLCQSLVGAFVAGGDSGSPTFGMHTDGTSFLAGILWGSSTNLTTGAVQFIFSPLSAVKRELGEMTTTEAPAQRPGKGKGPKKQP
jgi:hypothetical protein